MSEPIRDFHLSKYCIRCKIYTHIVINREDYMDWSRGKLIQNAMPYLTNEEKELLITGYCNSCFNAINPPQVTIEEGKPDIVKDEGEIKEIKE